MFFYEQILIYELYFMSCSQLYFWADWTSQGVACHSLGLKNLALEAGRMTKNTF